MTSYINNSVILRDNVFMLKLSCIFRMHSREVNTNYFYHKNNLYSISKFRINDTLRITKIYILQTKFYVLRYGQTFVY